MQFRTQRPHRAWQLDAQVAQLEINPELDVSVCNYLLCDEARGMFTKTEEAIARFEISEQDFLYRWNAVS